MKTKLCACGKAALTIGLCGECWIKSDSRNGSTILRPNNHYENKISEWASRHDIKGSLSDLRCAFEDAASS